MRQGGLFERIEAAGRSGYRPPDLPCLHSAGVRRVEFDVETTGLRWWDGDRPVGYALRWNDGHGRAYLGTRHAGGNVDPDRFREWARRELRELELVGLNVKFDAHMSYVDGIDLEAQGCTLNDVGHDAALLDDHRRYFSLESIAQDYLQRGKKGRELDKSKMGDYHASQVEEYALEDVELVGLIAAKTAPLLAEQDLTRVKQLENDIIFAVCEMERNAAPIDVPLLKRWVRESEQRLTRLLWEIYHETGVKVAPNSAKDIRRLFEVCDVPIVYFTETGQPSFSDDVLGNVAHPVIRKLRLVRKLDSLRSKYLVKYDNTVGADALLRYSLHQLRADEGGTVTGRFSCSGMRLNGDNEGANIQQVFTPEAQEEDGTADYTVRELFIGHEDGGGSRGMFLSADAAQIELRIFAHYANNPTMLAAYAQDPNTSFHQVVWDIVRKKLPDLRYKPLKNYNFANLYGAGLKKKALMTGLSVEEVKEIEREMNALMPEVPVLLRQASQLASDRGYVKTLLGRRSRFPTKERLHKAFNSVDQGGAGDTMKVKIKELHAERRWTGLKMSMTVHDEVCGTVPDVEAGERVREVLNRQTLPWRVPITWDVKVGRNWREC